MNSYEFKARYIKDRGQLRLLITGRLGKKAIGEPDLERIAPAPEGELLVMLVFRQPIQHHNSTFTWGLWEYAFPDPFRYIRILLPDFQEFIIVAKGEDPHHPIPTGLMDLTVYSSVGLHP